MVEHARSVFARPVLGTIPARTLHQQGRKGVGLHTQAGSTADLTATQILHNAFSRHGKYARWMENPRWQAGPLPSSVVQSLRKCSGQMGGSSQSSCRTATLTPNCRQLMLDTKEPQGIPVVAKARNTSWKPRHSLAIQHACSPRWRVHGCHFKIRQPVPWRCSLKL